MTVKTIHFLAIALLAAAVSSCQKDPSTSALHREYLVYTDRDRAADFAAFETFYLPDSILIIGSNKQTEYWKDADALEIVGTVAFELEAAGFLRTSEKQNADLGVQLSYVERETYFVGSNNPYWWWYYPYYWSPGYWGDWMGWFYPYRVYYGYTAGSLLLEMMDLKATRVEGKRLPVVWDSFMSGLLTSNASLNQERTLQAVEQAFAQSPYLYE
ncbi:MULTISPECIES: DUF4136 domain-containing protein [unclassified Alistipes]|uniref:DUF4136 domain-containing protein n=1 Tax=unclassified Alistipes TaxID=2608932 RepID=UPI00258BEF82|nr:MULTISPECIES: DUF4136 domain-containing protein [unclassified Alistipes]HUN13497.1 DUF4136 domain-containing protein [Alistipes sp.]